MNYLPTILRCARTSLGYASRQHVGFCDQHGRAPLRIELSNRSVCVLSWEREPFARYGRHVADQLYGFQDSSINSANHFQSHSSALSSLVLRGDLNSGNDSALRADRMGYASRQHAGFCDQYGRARLPTELSNRSVCALSWEREHFARYGRHVADQRI
jgi:hypothetical protein